MGIQQCCAEYKIMSMLNIDTGVTLSIFIIASSKQIDKR